MAVKDIAENYRAVRESLPQYVKIVAACKTRSAEEVEAIIDAGVTMVGENYVQEAEDKHAALGEKANQVEWHMIGHLQKNKINKALPVFDCFQCVDSAKLARHLNKRADRILPVYIEVNIAGEESKYGIEPSRTRDLARRICEVPKLRLEGLMTMEPYFEDPEDARPYFRRMRALFERLREETLPGASLEVLSMGMTNSYRVAVDEGSNMVRVGTALFGPREY